MGLMGPTRPRQGTICRSRGHRHAPHAAGIATRFIAALFCCVLPLRLSATTPHAVDDVIATNEHADHYNVLTNDYDVDSDTVKFVAVTQPAHGAASRRQRVSDGHVPAPNFNGVTPSSTGSTMAQSATGTAPP